jgi:hypothetical protein
LSIATIELDPVCQHGRMSNLVPFTPETAAEAGRRSGEAKRARKVAASADVRTAAAALDQVRAAFSRDQLGPDAAAAASYIVGRIVAGSIPLRNGSEAAELLRALVDVARLEAGQATSASAVLHVGADATARVLALRDQARAALGMGGEAVALAADDPRVPMVAGADDDGAMVPPPDVAGDG